MKDQVGRFLILILHCPHDRGGLPVVRGKFFENGGANVGPGAIQEEDFVYHVEM